MALQRRDQEFQRTLDAKPNDVSIVKPGELVDIVEMSPLTLADRRIYNLLIANAWDTITEPVQHTMAKRDLRSTLHKGTDRLDDSIKRLMAALVELRVMENGEWITKRVQLLGGNSIPDAPDGVFRYDFQPLMREIIGQSVVFARLHKQIMFALSSKYSLALYEMIQKRGNMNRTSEDLGMDEFRNFLGVPSGKLKSWINFKNFAIAPAVEEVSDMSDFTVRVDPIKGKGKKFDKIRLSWSRKSPGEVEKVKRELDNVKVGRKARLAGTVEQITFGPPALPRSKALRSDTYENAKRLFPGWDVYYLESEWRNWSADMEPPENPDAAFIAFSKQHVKNNPL